MPPTSVRSSPLPVSGVADLLVEHRSSNSHVNDIRLRAHYTSNFEILCARCVDPVAVPLSGDFDLIFRPERPMRTPESAQLQRTRPKSGIIKRVVFCWRMWCVSRCYSPCRVAPSARQTAKGFARAVVRT